jgi:hypothetical protein
MSFKEPKVGYIYRQRHTGELVLVVDIWYFPHVAVVETQGGEIVNIDFLMLRTLWEFFDEAYVPEEPAITVKIKKDTNVLDWLEGKWV